MYAVCVTVYVRKGHEKDFINASTDNARNTHNEEGNVRFDLLQCEQDPTQFFLYEVYKTPEDFTAHQKTTHYLKWRKTVADWMAEPRRGVRHFSLFPPDKDWL